MVGGNSHGWTQGGNTEKGPIRDSNLSNRNFRRVNQGKILSPEWCAKWSGLSEKTGGLEIIEADGGGGSTKVN